MILGQSKVQVSHCAARNSTEKNVKMTKLLATLARICPKTSREQPRNKGNTVHSAMPRSKSSNSTAENRSGHIH